MMIIEKSAFLLTVKKGALKLISIHDFFFFVLQFKNFIFDMEIFQWKKITHPCIFLFRYIVIVGAI